MAKVLCIQETQWEYFFVVVFLVLYVDDILIVGNSVRMLVSIKAWLSSCFSMKDLGEAQYILGIRIYRDRSGQMLGLSQRTYIDKVLDKFNMVNSKKGFSSHVS
jgi:reverse transcriptase-like protein